MTISRVLLFWRSPGTHCQPDSSNWPISAGRFTGARRSVVLGDHVDGATGAFLHTDPASLAEVVVELVAHVLAQLDDGVVRTDAEAVVAFKAVAARHAAACLKERVVFRETADDFFEVRLTPNSLEFWTLGAWCVRVVPGIEEFERREFVANFRLGAAPRHVTVDTVRRPLTVSDGDRRRALIWDGVTSREDAGRARHHRVEHLDGAVTHGD